LPQQQGPDAEHFDWYDPVVISACLQQRFHEPMNEVFDYVIVGAGSAGSVLARRLVDAGHTVCLLESGPSDSSPYIHVPAGFLRTLLDPRLTWRYKTAASERTAGRRIPAVHGRVVGGSSSVNGMVWVRGQPDDYDDWAAKGNPGWRFEDVERYFERAESMLGVTAGDWRHPLCDALINAAQEHVEPGAAAYYRRNIRRGRRVSSARAYLRPILRSPNLALRTAAHATTVRFQGRRAIGVDYLHQDQPGTPRGVRARREVIVCAGALASPRLLQVSGVGPRELLAELGIGMVHELPGVGENLRDHHTARIIARVRDVRTINEIGRRFSAGIEGLKWLLGQPSLLSVSAAITHVFGRSTPQAERPDVALIFTPGSYKGGVLGLLDEFPGMTLGAWPLRPRSSGTVQASTTDPFALPRVDPNYLGDEEDRRILIAGLKFGRRLLSSPAFAPYFAQEESPGPQAQSDDELLDHARRTGTTCAHFVGSCRMGPANLSDSVVDAQLRDHGVDALRVVDASVMPMITSGNTNAPTMMIAEKAADLLLQG